MICALKLITNSRKGTKLGIVVKSLEEGSKNMISDGKRQFVAADKKRTSVTMWNERGASKNTTQVRHHHIYIMHVWWSVMKC